MSSKISIGPATEDPEVLKFVSDHFQTNKMYKHAVKKLL